MQTFLKAENQEVIGKCKIIKILNNFVKFLRKISKKHILIYFELKKKDCLIFVNFKLFESLIF